MTTFKTCGCGKVYETLQQYKEETKLVKLRHVDGLTYVNCSCDSTHGVRSEDQEPEHREEILKLFEENPGYRLAKMIRAKEKQRSI